MGTSGGNTGEDCREIHPVKEMTLPSSTADIERTSAQKSVRDTPASLARRDAAVMKPHYEDTVTQPLASDSLIEQRISALVGRACRRQLWFLFVDGKNVQLPLIIPVSDPPVMPDPAVAQLVGNIVQAGESMDAHSVIVVLERDAGSQFSPADKAWACALDTAFGHTELHMRAILVSHSRGVRWFAPDDYRFDSTGQHGPAAPN